MKIKTPKMLKVMYNGDHLCYVYPHATWFQVLKYRIARGMRIALIESLVAIAILGIYTAGQMSTTSIYVKADDKSDYMYQTKIEGLKDAVMSKLSLCEGAGHKESDGLIIMDTNNKISVGLFQWQISSVQHYYKLMTGKDITAKEATILALDNERARELAKFVAFNTKNKIGKDWVNCNAKYNLDAQVDIIKSMQ